jgi:hypothetical protein
MADQSTDQTGTRGARKAYRTPTLVKGPLLSRITATTPVSGAAICWVARAAFGESDIRWMIFRAWLTDDAPLWFRRLYIRHGESVGQWVAGRDHARSCVRALMMPAIRRKLGLRSRRA